MCDLAGKVVYGGVIAAALSADGSAYFNKCWRHAAGHVVSPPLRQGPLNADHLLDLLAKSVVFTAALFLTAMCCYGYSIN